MGRPPTTKGKVDCHARPTVNARSLRQAPISSPIVLAWPMDAPPAGCSTPPPWHIDAVGGRPDHQGGNRDVAHHCSKALWANGANGNSVRRTSIGTPIAHTL